MAAGFDIIVIGGGHAGAEAAWAAANLGARVALVTMDPSKIGAMSCNPAIGGLAKGQMVREIDALGGLMALATDATGIQFRMLNASKGSAVHGPRAQCDKYAYAREVQRLLALRENVTIIGGTVERLLVEDHRVLGVELASAPGPPDQKSEIRNQKCLSAPAVVLTTGTFMRGLMHTGERQTPGGRVGEGSAEGISGALRSLGFELGRLKTGTPPRLAAETIEFERLELQPGDESVSPFSDLTLCGGGPTDLSPWASRVKSLARFPVSEQRPCHITHTSEPIHELIRGSLGRAPLYNGQIGRDHVGPRYCPSIEDKVVRFREKRSHHVFLEPESLDTNEVYCNGISTSLPADVQDYIVAHLPGCERAKVLRYGYAVEYDMVWPHQIHATGMTKLVEGLFLAGQINGTSGYEEAAGQGLVAGVNAVRYARGQSPWVLRRDQAYIGVMMDDLVTRTPREPYRMFTSRAEFRLLLRADNTADRLTPVGRELGLIDGVRWRVFERRRAMLDALHGYLQRQGHEGQRLVDVIRRPEVEADWVAAQLNGELPSDAKDRRIVETAVADVKYAGYIERQKRDVHRLAQLESIELPAGWDYTGIVGLRNEARHVLERFRPTTVGQASRLAGITPADVMLLTVAARKVADRARVDQKGLSCPTP